MHDLVYPKERTLGTITLVIGVLIWLGLIIGTFGVALIALLLGFLIHVFIQSALIAHIKGNGVELSARQFPDLYARFADCCTRLKLKKRPRAYVLQGEGSLNAFATQFLGQQFVVLLSSVVDAMEEHPDGVNFYIGHELGHLRMGHLTGAFLRWPAMWIPLLAAAYARARESTCDLHGLACSSQPEHAGRALAALAAGSTRWRQLDLPTFQCQTEHTSGFWMSFHELTAGYPWISKRVWRVMDPEAKLPQRSALAFVLAALFPYAGRLGPGFGMLMLVYIVGVTAATAVPAYHDYQVQAELTATVSDLQPVLEKLGSAYTESKQIPATLEELGIAPNLANGTELTVNPSNMVVTAKTTAGELVFVPSEEPQGGIKWSCQTGEGLKPAQLPAACRQ